MITDSREFQKRIEDLASDIADNHNELYPTKEDLHIDMDDVIEHNYNYLLNSTHDTKEEIDELFQLLEFKDSVGSREWDHGLVFIGDDSFVDYIKQQLIDCNDVLDNIPDYVVIDWEATAENMQHDYSCAELNDKSYYYID